VLQPSCRSRPNKNFLHWNINCYRCRRRQVTASFPVPRRALPEGEKIFFCQMSTILREICQLLVCFTPLHFWTKMTLKFETLRTCRDRALLGRPAPPGSVRGTHRLRSENRRARWVPLPVRHPPPPPPMFNSRLLNPSTSGGRGLYPQTTDLHGVVSPYYRPQACSS